jgi:hypothetical protein
MVKQITTFRSQQKLLPNTEEKKYVGLDKIISSAELTCIFQYRLFIGMLTVF